MKNNKGITKPSFRRILLKRLLIGSIICAVICTAALITAAIVYKNYIYDKGQERAIERLTYIESELKEVEKGGLTYSNMNSHILDINNYMTAEACYESVEKKPYIACRILDKDKKVIADSSQLMHLSISEYSDTDTVQSKYLCHPDVYDDVYKAFVKYNDMINSDDFINSDKEYGIFVYEAYIDGKYFYPRLSLRSVDKEDFYKNALGEWKEEDAVEFYPKDTSSLWYVEYKDKKTMMYFSACEDYTDAAVENSLDKYIKGDMFKEGEYKNVFVFRYRIDSQPEYTLVCAFPYSFVGRFPLLTVICAASAFAVTLVIVLIGSRLSYADRKAQYEIFTARRQTTNAMAHDLKTPLTSIAGYVEMLQGDINPQKQKHYLEMITKNVEQMNNTVTDILALAKSESASRVLVPEEISAEDTCRQVIEEISGTLEANGLTSKLDVKKSVVIKADRKLFEQALKNLLHNAAVYSKQGTSVDITLTDKSLCIVNVPRQMPKLSAEELVKPFVKDNSYRGENAGSGVGLAIAKQNLERMGFELKLEISDNSFSAICVFK